MSGRSAFQRSCILSGLLALAMAGSASATSYYVSTTGSDSNNGTSEGTAWLTLNKALGSTGIPSGTNTLYVKSGTYTSTLVNMNNRPSSDNLTIEGYYSTPGDGSQSDLGNNKPDISTTSTSDCIYANPASVTGSYTFRNLKISPAIAGNNAIFKLGLTNPFGASVTINRCTIQSSAAIDGSAAGLLKTGSNANDVTRNFTMTDSTIYIPDGRGSITLNNWHEVTITGNTITASQSIQHSLVNLQRSYCVSNQFDSIELSSNTISCHSLLNFYLDTYPPGQTPVDAPTINVIIAGKKMIDLQDCENPLNCQNPTIPLGTFIASSSNWWKADSQFDVHDYVPGSENQNPKLVPWFEWATADQLDALVTSLRAWQEITDTAVVTTDPATPSNPTPTSSMYSLLKQRVPGMRIIPGLKTSPILNWPQYFYPTFDSVGGWNLIATYVTQILHDCGDEELFIFEHESALVDYLYGNEEINFSTMRTCLDKLPIQNNASPQKNITYIWYGDSRTALSMVNRSYHLDQVVEEKLNVRFVDSTTASTSATLYAYENLNSSMWKELSADQATIPHLLVQNGSGNWLYSQVIPGARDHIKQYWPGESWMIIYPGYARWTESASALSYATHQSYVNICIGGTAHLWVTPTGTGPFTYQWQKNGSNLTDGGHYSGTTTATLKIAGADSSDVATYHCVVNSTTYGDTALSLKAATAITQQPSNQYVYRSDSAEFTVTATGCGTLAYQWQKEGVNLVDGGTIEGATTATLYVIAGTNEDYGHYRCVVTGDCGNVTSNSAVLTIPPDFDADVDVDVDDMDIFDACYDPENPTSGDCLKADFNSDQYVDDYDDAVFMDCYNGPSNPPGC